MVFRVFGVQIRRGSEAASGQIWAGGGGAAHQGVRGGFGPSSQPHSPGAPILFVGGVIRLVFFQGFFLRHFFPICFCVFWGVLFIHSNLIL